MSGILNKKKKKDGSWTDLKQSADVPCVLHAHCSPDVGPMKINTCEGPLSLSLCLPLLGFRRVTAAQALVVIPFLGHQFKKVLQPFSILMRGCYTTNTQ